MTSFLDSVPWRWRWPATSRWGRLSRLRMKSKRYVGVLLMLLTLGSLASSAAAARSMGDPAMAVASDARAPQETVVSRELAHEADLRWASRSQADLRGQTLEGATLTGANLRGADLREVDLAGAALLGTHLRDANLSGAVLRQADLHWAILTGADLRGADLRGANLQWVDLQDADLRDAQLAHARLQRAYLHGATLPDGTRWKPGRDLGRFTDTAHPAYWGR